MSLDFLQKARRGDLGGLASCASRTHVPSLLESPELEELLALGGLARENATGNKITFSRNAFVPVSRSCTNDCTYCNFKGGGDTPGSLLFPIEALDGLVREARGAGCTELLLCGGERADTLPAVRDAIVASGIGSGSMVDWLARACTQALDGGMLPHVNVGHLDRAELAMLKPLAASMGIMMEIESERLSGPGGPHEFSPGKAPGRRSQVIAAAGELHIPFTSGLLLGIGETLEEVVTTLSIVRGHHELHGHVQEVIIQGLEHKTLEPWITVPREGARIDLGREDFLEYMLLVVALARLSMPADVAVQVPPNLVGLEFVVKFIKAGANDLGGVSPVTKDEVNPGSAWPAIDELSRALGKAGYILAERLAVHDKFLTNPSFLPSRVAGVIAGLGWPRHNVSQW